MLAPELLPVSPSAVPADALRRALLADRARVLTALYADAFPLVRRYVRRHGGAAEDAQDVFHEALVIFYEKAVAGTLALTGPPGVYVAGIARNRWRRELERRQRGAPLTDELADALTDDPGEVPPAEGNQLTMIEYVERLGARCRDLLVSFYYFRQPLEQITRTHAYGSVRSATVQKYKCLERLRTAVRHLTRDHFTA